MQDLGQEAAPGVAEGFVGLTTLRGELQQAGPAVLGVDGPAHQAVGFEVLHLAAHRRQGDPEGAGDVGEPRPPRLADAAQDGVGRPVERESGPGGHGLVEAVEVGLAQDGREGVLDGHQGRVVEHEHLVTLSLILRRSVAPRDGA